MRRGQQIAKRLNGDLHVASLWERGKKRSEASELYKRNLMQLCGKVNASFREVALRSRRDMPGELLRHAMQLGATRIVLGHSRQSRWESSKRTARGQRELQAVYLGRTRGGEELCDAP